VVVAILYPEAWYGDAEAFAAEVTALEALDPRVEVVVEAYEEPHDLRIARGRGASDELAQLAPVLTDAQRAAFARAEVAVAIDLPTAVASLAPGLRWVQAVGAGTEQLRSVGLADAGITLTSNGGSNAIAIAEFVIARILQEAKRFRELEAHQAAHDWENLFGAQLAGQTIGLVGLGAINQGVAARAQALGLRVLATKRTIPDEPVPHVDELFPTSDLAAMTGQCDVVVCAVPETPETIGMIGRDELAAMKPGAMFVNVGRGSLVDEAALIDALRSGALRAAALDVTAVEPLPADDPLWDAPNLYLSFHCSSSPSALFPNLHRVFRANLARYLAGEDLEHQVAPGRGY
jgi:phosphoglycerate dehydrogenase-like enzyme